MKERVEALEKFQSTLPVRGATEVGLLCSCPVAISIHAPREGSDVQDAARLHCG